MLHYQFFFTIFGTIVLFVPMFVTRALGIHFCGLWNRVRKVGLANNDYASCYALEIITFFFTEIRNNHIDIDNM
jgi:hypothetical protein